MSVLPRLALAIAVLGIVSGAVWTYLDATEHADLSEVFWSAGVLLCYPLILPYMYFRGKSGREETDSGNLYCFSALSTTSIAVSLIVGSVISPPDPVTQSYYFFGVLVVSIAVGSIYFWHRFR